VVDSRQAPKFYEVFDHTADLGLYIFGEDWRALLGHAGEAFADLITDSACLKPYEEIRFEIQGETQEELLLRMLKELLYRFDTERRLFTKFTFENAGDNLVLVRAWGETFDLHRHPFKTEIKAVTRHGLKVEKWGEGLRATVIFDI